MATRATAVTELRTAIDRSWGCPPCPIAGAPPTVAHRTTVGRPLHPPARRRVPWARPGRLLAGGRPCLPGPGGRRRGASTCRSGCPGRSGSRPAGDEAPLGATQLGALAPALHASARARPVPPAGDHRGRPVAPGRGLGCARHRRDRLRGPGPVDGGRRHALRAGADRNRRRRSDRDQLRDRRRVGRHRHPVAGPRRPGRARPRHRPPPGGPAPVSGWPPSAPVPRSALDHAAGGGGRWAPLHARRCRSPVPPSQQSRRGWHAGTSQQFLVLRSPP